MVAVLGLIVNAYLVGRKQGRMDEKLSTNQTAIKETDSIVKKRSEEIKKSDKQDSILVAYRSKVREKVVVVHDTIKLKVESGGLKPEQECSQNGNDCTQNGNDCTQTVHSGVNDSATTEQIVVVSPEVAQLIQADDSTIRALQHSLALRDTLIATLHRTVELRDGRIKLLDREPGKLKRIITATKWIAVGAVIGAAFSK